MMRALLPFFLCMRVRAETDYRGVKIDWDALPTATHRPRMTRPSTVLVTGGAGFLGSFVVERLRRRGCEPFVPRSADYDLRLTQQWILSPEAELEWHSKDDVEREIGSGFSEFELGLRLRYEIRRGFAPYLGVNWERKLGDTADIARDNGEDTSEFQVVLGVRAWF